MATRRPHATSTATTMAMVRNCEAKPRSFGFFVGLKVGNGEGSGVSGDGAGVGNGVGKGDTDGAGVVGTGDGWGLRREEWEGGRV